VGVVALVVLVVVSTAVAVMIVLKVVVMFLLVFVLVSVGYDCVVVCLCRCRWGQWCVHCGHVRSPSATPFCTSSALPLVSMRANFLGHTTSRTLPKIGEQMKLS
jgi:hypothetical protein